MTTASNKFRVLALVFVLLVGFHASKVAADFESGLSFLQSPADTSSCRDGIETRVEELEGLVERGRRLLDEQQEGSILREVNLFFYRYIQLATDSRIWGRGDYWATPADTLCVGSGDTEDFAIAKYFALAEIGIPEDRLRLTYAQSTWFGPVVVLLYYAPDGGTRVLHYRDIWDLQEVAGRRLLHPVYAVNDQTLWKVSHAWRFTPLNDAKGMKLWQEVLRRTRPGRQN